jgi:DNA-directed RNA polymerase subunit N (RpoN/RPB10)
MTSLIAAARQQTCGRTISEEFQRGNQKTQEEVEISDEECPQRPIWHTSSRRMLPSIDALLHSQGQ